MSLDKCNQVVTNAEIAEAFVRNLYINEIDPNTNVI